LTGSGFKPLKRKEEEEEEEEDYCNL